jgi:hypothetical protein
MASDAQYEANRANAQHSTGPRTEEGKNRSRFNSVKHGLTADRLLIPGEDPAEFELLRDEFLEAYNPQGAQEELLTGMLIGDFWRLRRQRQVESGVLATNLYSVQIADEYQTARAIGIREENRRSGAEPTEPSHPKRVAALSRIAKLTDLLSEPTTLLGRAYEQDVKGSNVLDRASRYEGTLRARIERTLKQLESLQAARREAEAKAAADAAEKEPAAA